MPYDVLEPESKGYDVIEPEKGYDVLEPAPTSTATTPQPSISQSLPGDINPEANRLPDLQATTRGGPPLSVPEGAMRSTLGEIGNAVGDLRQVPGEMLSGLEHGAAAALNIPEAMYRQATGITPKEMLITPESITQRDQPLHFQAGKPVVSLGAESAMQPEGNAASRLIEGFLTPGNIAAFPFAGSKVVQALFLSQMAPAAVAAATKLVDPKLNRLERQEAATELLISGMMTYGIGKHLVDTPAKALARQIGGAEFEPRPETAPVPIVETMARPAKAEQLAPLTTAEVASGGEMPSTSGVQFPVQEIKPSLTPATDAAAAELLPSASEEAAAEPPALVEAPPPVPETATGATAKKPVAEFPKLISQDTKRGPVWGVQTSQDYVAWTGSKGSAESFLREHLLRKSTTPTATGAKGGVNPFDTSATSAKLTQLDQSKPRPTDKLFGKTGGTPELRAANDSKIRQWNNARAKAVKEHRAMVEKSNEWIRNNPSEQVQPTPPPPAATEAKPITEVKFEQEYAQHIDLRSRGGDVVAQREKILREGFKKGANVNALPPSRGRAPQNVIERNFQPKNGDLVLLAPKEAWKSAPNGMEIKDGWKPKPHEAIIIGKDNPDMYQEYLRAKNEAPPATTGATAKKMPVETTGSDPLFEKVADPSTVVAGTYVRWVPNNEEANRLWGPQEGYVYQDVSKAIEKGKSNMLKRATIQFLGADGEPSEIVFLDDGDLYVAKQGASRTMSSVWESYYKHLDEYFRTKWNWKGSGPKDTYEEYKSKKPVSKPTDDLVKEAILNARTNGPTPEFRALFGGIDPELAGTTSAQVEAYAKSLGLIYREVAKAARDTVPADKPTTPAATGAEGEPGAKMEKPKSPIETLNTAKRVLIKAPEGATFVRGTDSKGRFSVRPISEVNKGANDFFNADIVKLESGTKNRKGEFQPMAGDVTVEAVGIPTRAGKGGPGSAAAGEPGSYDPAQELSDKLRTIKEQDPLKRAQENTRIADAWEAGKTTMEKAWGRIVAVKESIKSNVLDLPERTPVERLVAALDYQLQKSSAMSRDMGKAFEQSHPNKARRNGIAILVDSGMDVQKVNDAIAQLPANTPSRVRRAFEVAANLTDAERATAETIKHYFEQRLQDAQQAGVLKGFLEDYYTHVWKKPERMPAELQNAMSNGRVVSYFENARERKLEDFISGVKLGYEPILDPALVLPRYNYNLDRAIASRAFIKKLSETTEADGRPTVAPTGVGKQVSSTEFVVKNDETGRTRRVFETKDEADAAAREGESVIERENTATIISPKAKSEAMDKYIPVDNPALRKWKWATNDTQGNPIIVEGDLLVHPDAVNRIKNIMERERLTPSKGMRRLIRAGAEVKGAKLGVLSPFHQIHVGSHAVWHLVNPFSLKPEIDWTHPATKFAVEKGGLKLAADFHDKMAFSEGVGPGLLIQKIVPYSRAYSEYLFESFIPRLKLKTFEAVYERDLKRYGGKLSNEQIASRAGDAVNNAYGELNRLWLGKEGRDPSLQRAMQVTLLAPDFLEARARFVAKAFTKYGKEEQMALFVMAAGMYVTARVLNQLIDGDPHADELRMAFAVRQNGRNYGIRSVVGDATHLVTDWRSFASTRINPLTTRTAIELLFKRNIRTGESVSTAQEVADLARQVVPSQLDSMLPGDRDWWFGFVQSLGVTSRREPTQQDLAKRAKAEADDAAGKRPYEFIKKSNYQEKPQQK